MSAKQIQYQKIKALFDEALNYPQMPELNSKKLRYLVEVAKLAEHTLYQFEKNSHGFDYETSLSLATRTRDLTLKVLADKATAADVAHFDKANTKLKGSKALAIAATILAAIVGIALGLTTGFLLAAGPVVAGVAGTVGGVGTSVGVGFFALGKKPVEKVSEVASQMAAKNRAHPLRAFTDYDSYGSCSSYSDKTTSCYDYDDYEHDSDYDYSCSMAVK